MPERPRTSLSPVPIGTRVEIGPAYMGGGQWKADGATGYVGYVVRFLAPADYKLARTPGGPWEWICHESRLQPVQD